jgi:hypothetical protein
MATSLFLFGSEQRRAASALAAIWKIGRDQQKEANTLPEVANEIGKYKNLDQLILYYHGIPGGIILDDVGAKLSEPEISKGFAKTSTKIEHIGFEGCWVGEAPDEMAAFGRLFSAKDVSGYTWTCWNNEIEVTIPKGVTAKGLQDVLKLYETWLMPGTPPLAQLASMAGRTDVKKKLLMLWYQYTLDEKPPYLDDNYKRSGSHTYKTRADATKRSVAAKDAKTSDVPIPPFEYVTVKM